MYHHDIKQERVFLWSSLSYNLIQIDIEKYPEQVIVIWYDVCIFTYTWTWISTVLIIDKNA